MRWSAWVEVRRRVSGLGPASGAAGARAPLRLCSSALVRKVGFQVRDIQPAVFTPAQDVRVRSVSSPTELD